MDSEYLRNKYIEFITQLRDEKTFNEGIYDFIFDSLTLQVKQWKINNSVPIRLFEVCIDLLYGLSGDDLNLPETILERVRYAKDEIYGLLMGFE